MIGTDVDRLNLDDKEPKNPLKRDGVAQAGREMPALSSDFVRVDEKELADFLIFAYELSEQIKYYNIENQDVGNWRNFFESCDLIQISRISKTRPEEVLKKYNQLHKKNDTKGQLDICKQMLESIKGWYDPLTNSNPLKSSIYAIAKNNLLSPLKLLKQIDGSSQPSIIIFDLNLLEESNVIPTQVDDIFRSSYKVYSHIIKQITPQALQNILYNSEQTLQPHLALYVAFWEVLKPAREDLNRMTRRHLDFFYREVLRLSEKQAIPDKAHIILELEKFQPDYRLEGQRKLSAGADATGVDLLYTLDEEIVVNRAQVVELKSIFLHTQKNEQTAEGDQDRKILDIHVSEIANFSNGKGGNFPKELSQAWKPFGDTSRTAARLGLAIASNILLLGEGDRTITFTFTLKFSRPPSPSILGIWPDNLKGDVNIKFSGKTDWMEGKIKEISIAPDASQKDCYKLNLVAYLNVEFEPIVPYHQDLSERTLATDCPTAQIFFLHPDANLPAEQYPSQTVKKDASVAGASAYHYLQQATLQTVNIAVKVKGIHNLLVQNDLSVLDATKPFQPFGFHPKVGSNFYIGSQEVFQKHLTELKIFFDLEREPPQIEQATSFRRKWERVYGAYGAYQDVQETFNPGLLTIQALRKRQWNAAIEASLFQEISSEDKGTEHKFKYGLNLDPVMMELNTMVQQPFNAATLEPWTYQSQYGFLKFELKYFDFLHADYPKVLALQVLANATQGNESNPATNPKNKSDNNKKRKAIIGACYQNADGKIFVAKKDNSYVDLNAIPLLPEDPYTPVIKSLQIDYQAIATQKECQLFHLHPFDGFDAIFDGFADLPNNFSESKPINLLPKFEHDGELLIGLQDLEPSTPLSLLFQVLPETADSSLKKTPVSWHYLVDNTWKKLEDHLVTDKSNGLIHSGIVKISIPDEISKEKTTILNPALNWIKATVDRNPDAIPQIVNIHTQTVEVTFVDVGNDPMHLATPLPKELITKFTEPPPEIKAVKQPYPSFGGKVKEQSNQFDVRVSERLRHKGRAITIFDYERLVLEQFPEVYKVRCINHGKFTDDKKLHEIAPGHVTVVVVPKLSQDLEHITNPKVNINLLDEIQQYLEKCSSPWAKIRVINPVYQEIRVSLKMQLKPVFQSDFEVYRRELERAIIRFLSPWVVTGAEGENITHFGSNIYRSSILKFVTDQPYVDYVVSFRLYANDSNEDRDIVYANSAHSIIVPAPCSDTFALGNEILPIYPPLLSYKEEIE